MLENEEKNENAEFRVKEVQYIQAEVGPLFISVSSFYFKLASTTRMRLFVFGLNISS
jgi:hypothetical protein